MIPALLLYTLTAADLRVTPAGGLKALEQSRDAMRASGQPGTVTLTKGDYFLPHSFALDHRDPAGAIYRAEPGVRLIGGVRIKQWSKPKDRAIVHRLPAAARAHVRVANVAQLGALTARGFGRPHQPAHSELFFNGQRMTVARWPNEGFTRLGPSLDPDPPDDGHGKKLGRLPYGFRVTGDPRPLNWKPDPNIWIHGYWAWDWADTYERVASLDPKTGDLKTAAPHGLYGFRQNQRYYFLNVLEELDSPGEYWLDSDHGHLYFWPPASNGETIVSLNAEPLIAINSARQITLEGFALTATRGHAITITGGEAVTLRGMKITQAGNSGVIIDGGRAHAVERSEIADTGDSAIELTGGDRATLTPGAHRVEDCDIHHMGQWVRTYNPAVKVNGVGHRVAHNHIHHAPHAGILLTGNDHLIEFNDIHHLALETGDVGAIYIGRDYTERGTIIRSNYIHELGGVGFGSMAVYLDDCASGITVSGNIFYKLKFGAFLGGGRDNRVENNVFVDCQPAIHLDARGIDPRPVWQNMVYQLMKPKLESMPALYSQRYPLIETIRPYLARPGGVPPEGNIIRRNLFHGGTGLGIRDVAKPYAKDVSDNTTVTDPNFFDPATGRYRLPAGVTFAPIPVDQIGPHRVSASSRR